MGKDTGQKIGALVGLVEEVDVNDDEPGWGEYLRVKVMVDLSKPLARGRMLHVQNRSIWIAFKYEKLSKFCNKCGVIIHGRLGCSRFGRRRSPSNEEEQLYGPWLRVIFPTRRGMGGDPRSGRNRATGDEGVPQTQRTGATVGCHTRTSPMDEDSGEGGADDSIGRNPSRLVVSPIIDKKCKLREGINEEDTYHIGRIITGGSAEEYTRELRGGKDIESPQNGKSDVENPTVSNWANSGKLPQKFVDHWDSVLNRMIWHNLGEGENIQLEKDLGSVHVFPTC
jgi:hypothetical protein